MVFRNIFSGIVVKYQALASTFELGRTGALSSFNDSRNFYFGNITVLS